jgi:hypothetical protein
MDDCLLVMYAHDLRHGAFDINNAVKIMKRRSYSSEKRLACQRSTAQTSLNKLLRVAENKQAGSIALWNTNLR